MTTRTDGCLKLIYAAIEKHRTTIDENQNLQDIKITIKLKRGWPFRAVVTENSTHEFGDG